MTDFDDLEGLCNSFQQRRLRGYTKPLLVDYCTQYLEEETTGAELFLEYYDEEMEHMEQNFEIIFEALQSNKNIQHVFIDSLHPHCASDLAYALQSNTTITELFMRCGFVEDFEILGEALATYNKTITCLDIDLYRTYVPVLVDVICFNTTITELRLGGGEEEMKNQLDRFEILREALEVNTSITTIDIKWWPGDTLAKLLTNNGTITKVCVRGDQLDFSKKLERVLKEVNTNVTGLRLMGNNFYQNTGENLQNMLQVNQTITYLGLSAKNFLQTNDGLAAMTSVLETNKTIRDLDLSWNHSHKLGMVIVDCLKENSTITKLNLEGNDIGNEECIKMALALEKNASLLELKLGHNNLSDEIARPFGELFTHNKAMMELDLSGNLIGEEVYDMFLKVLKTHKNTTLTKLELAGVVTHDFDVVDDEHINQDQLDQIEHYIKLNKAGRKVILNENATRRMQLEVLIHIRHEVDIAFEFLRLKPVLCTLPEAFSAVAVAATPVVPIPVKVPTTSTSDENNDKSTTLRTGVDGDVPTKQIVHKKRKLHHLSNGLS